MLQILQRSRGETVREQKKCHCERSEAIQEALETLDCFVSKAPRNDGIEHSFPDNLGRYTTTTPGPFGITMISASSPSGLPSIASA